MQFTDTKNLNAPKAFIGCRLQLLNLKIKTTNDLPGHKL